MWTILHYHIELVLRFRNRWRQLDFFLFEYDFLFAFFSSFQWFDYFVKEKKTLPRNTFYRLTSYSTAFVWSRFSSYFAVIRPLYNTECSCLIYVQNKFMSSNSKKKCRFRNFQFFSLSLSVLTLLQRGTLFIHSIRPSMRAINCIQLLLLCKIRSIHWIILRKLATFLFIRPIDVTKWQNRKVNNHKLLSSMLTMRMGRWINNKCAYWFSNIKYKKKVNVTELVVCMSLLRVSKQKKNRFIHPFIALHEMEKKSQFLESTLTNLR